MLRYFRINFLIILNLLAVLNANAAPSRPFGYEKAEEAFQTNFDLQQRILVQVLLIAAGYTNFVPSENFNPHIFKFIQNFQNDNGLSPNGVIDKQELDKLFVAASPMLNLWGFKKINHPTRGIPLWIPLGLGLTVDRNPYGLHYTDPQRRVILDFTTVPNLFIGVNFETLVNSQIAAGSTIHYKVIKDGWFVISLTTSGGIDAYLRYHQDGRNVTGFSLYWNNTNGNVHSERIAILMSASLRSAMSGTPYIDPPAEAPRPAVDTVASPPTPVVAPSPVSPPSLPSPSKSAESLISTGSGFFVTQDGTLVTNAHVIENCSRAVVKTSDGAVTDAQIVARDTINDLAILKVNKTPARIAALRIGVRLGESVAAFGFPHSDILATSGNFTLGNVTALSGLGDDSRFFQISAPVQAGNSGGPLLDQNGNLIGIVAAKLNALKVAMQDGDLPQNVNFAIKATILAAFLDSNRISIQQGTETRPMNSTDIADEARDMSAFIACQ